MLSMQHISPNKIWDYSDISMVVALEKIKRPKVTMHRLRHPTPTHPTTTRHTHTHTDATHTVCKNGRIRGMTANFPFFPTVYITSYSIGLSLICHMIWSHITSYLKSYFMPYSMTYRIIISYHIIYHIISYWRILERVHVNISVFIHENCVILSMHLH